MAENRAHVSLPAYPRIAQEPDDHYQILRHAAGEIDLTATDEGRAVLRRYKADSDADDAAKGRAKPPRIPDEGELPPNHLDDDERAKWLERQRTRKLLPGDLKKGK